MASRGGARPKETRKRSAEEFPSEEQQEEISRFCTPGEEPAEGLVFETNIDQANVPIKTLANVRTIVYPLRWDHVGSPLYRRILCTWGMPAAFRGGLRAYRHWTDADVSQHLRYVSGLVNKNIMKVGEFDWEKSFTPEQIEKFKTTDFYQDTEYDRPSLKDIREKWKNNQIQFPTCATDEGNVKYRQILLHRGLTLDLRKQLKEQGLNNKDIDRHLIHMTMFFKGTSIPVQKPKQKGLKPTTLTYQEFPRRATGAELSDEDEENAERPTTIDFSQEWKMQEERGLNKAKLSAKDMKRIEQGAMETEDVTGEPTQGTSGVHLDKELKLELSRVDAGPRRVQPEFVGPIEVNELELFERNRLRTVYLAMRRAKEEKDDKEVEALTEQLDHVRLNLHNVISPDYVEPELDEIDIDLFLSLADFIVTYESLVALLANIIDQQGMHKAIVQAREYSHFIEHRNDEVTNELRSEIQAFMMTNHDLFDNLEVNPNIGTQGLPGDWKIKKEILEHAMDAKYTEKEIGIVTEVKLPSDCKYEDLATYYRKHSKEELEEAQEFISSKMDEIDQAYDAANVEDLGVLKAKPRGASRHMGTGVGDDDDWGDEDNDDDDDDDEDTLDYLETQRDDDDNEFVHMDEDNTTGLKIDQVISMKTVNEDEPMDIEPDDHIAPPIHHVDVLEKDMIVTSNQDPQNMDTKEQQKNVSEIDSSKMDVTPATPLKEKETDVTPESTPVEKVTPEPLPPPPGPEPQPPGPEPKPSEITPEPKPPGPEPKSMEITPEPQQPVLPEPKAAKSDPNKDSKDPSQEIIESEEKEDPEERLFPGKFQRPPLKAKPLRKMPKQTARKSTGGKPASDSRDKKKDKSTKRGDKSKVTGSPKRSKPELGENDDTPVKKQKKKKVRKLSSSSEGEDNEEVDVLPKENPTRFSGRLAGKEAEKLELPKSSGKKRVPKTREGTVIYGRSDRWTTLVFSKRPHPKPTLPQKYVMEYDAADIELKSIAVQVTEPRRAKKVDPAPFVLYGNLPPRKENLTKAPTLKSTGLSKDQLVEKIMLAQAKERENLQQRGFPVPKKVQPILNKKNNFTPGALALAEIQHYQEVDGLILSPTVLKRLCLEIARDINEDLQFDHFAYRLLHKASEEYLMRIFRDCSLIASLNNKTTIDERDVIVVRRISGDYGKHNTWGTGYQEQIKETRMTPEASATSRAGYKQQFKDWKSDWAEYKEKRRKQPKENIKKK